MRVLLPQFILNPLSETKMTANDFKRVKLLQRTRTMETIQSHRQQSPNYRHIMQTKTNQSRPIISSVLVNAVSHSRTCMFEPQELSSNCNRKAVFKIQKQNNTIHSRKNYKLYTPVSKRQRSILNKTTCTSQQQSKLNNKSFVIDCKCLLIPQQEHPQQSNYSRQMPNYTYRQYERRLPNKKTKTAFTKEDYRPWSPKKVQLNSDDLVY